MLREEALEIKVAHLVAAGVEVEYAVEAGGQLRYHIVADMKVGLEGAGGADPHYVEAPQVAVHGPCPEVDVGEGVKLRQHYLHVVGTDAVGNAHHRLPPVGATYGMEFTRLHVVVYGVEHRGHHVDTSRVAHEDNVVAQLVGAQMDMEDRAVVIDDQLGRGYDSFFRHVFVL